MMGAQICTYAVVYNMQGWLFSNAYVSWTPYPPLSVRSLAPSKLVNLAPPHGSRIAVASRRFRVCNTAPHGDDMLTL